MILSTVFELMDGGHEGALIKIWDDHSAVEGPFPHASFTRVIVFDPGLKRPAANGTTGMVNFGKIVHAGHADRKPGPVRIPSRVPQKLPTYRTPGGIDEVDELPENGHGKTEKTEFRIKTLTHLLNNSF